MFYSTVKWNISNIVVTLYCYGDFRLNQVVLLLVTWTPHRLSVMLVDLVSLSWLPHVFSFWAAEEGFMFEHPVPMVKTRIKETEPDCMQVCSFFSDIRYIWFTQISLVKSRHMSKPQKSKYSAFKEHGTSKKQTNYLGTNNVIYYKM